VTARIVLAAKPFAETVALLSPLGNVAAPDEGVWEGEELAGRLGRAEALMAFMTTRVDAALLARAPHLRIVAGALKGADNLDREACAARGVAVTVVPDLLTAPTAELAIALALGLARQLVAGDRMVRAGHPGWRPVLYGLGLAGARVAILGQGALGRAIADRLHPFGCDLRRFDRDGPPLATVLHGADLVIAALPLTPATRGMLGRDKLALLPAGALLVNVGRGSTVDELAVAEALAAGTLGGYAADVFAFEDLSLSDRPPGVPDALLAMPDRTLFTPHLGSATRAARRAIEAEAAAAIQAALRDAPARA
jgi:phosphonate dehydrogenase